MTDTFRLSISYTDITLYEQLEQLRIEIGNLRSSNEALKISGRELLERAPPLIILPRRSNILQKTLDDIIQKQANEIQRLHDGIEREKSQCLRIINELELKWEKQLKRFVERSSQIQKKNTFI